MRTSPLTRICLALTLVAAGACSDDSLGPQVDPGEPALAKSSAPIGINVGLDGPLTSETEARLSEFGTIAHQIPDLDVVLMVGLESDIPAIARLPFVAFAEPDTEVSTGPLDAELAPDMTGGLGTWNLDAVNVTQPGFANRTVAETGEGVYVGMLDTGLLHTWRLHFPEERIATGYARAFSGGWHPNASNPVTPNAWEKDVSGHGTHVTSTIIGYSFRGTPVAGVAPKATVIPVKVLGQNGTGWTSMVAEGLVYMGNLKAGPLAAHPVVVNMSLGGGPSALKDRAVDYAIARGVIIVAAAGNSGTRGMAYPGAYEPVISVASAGWGDCVFPVTSVADCFGQWTAGNWWWAKDVPEGSGSVDGFYISGFSSRALAGQDLDVVAPGHWVVGPFQTNNAADASYFFLSGTSMASPHVAGIVALMAERDPALTAARAEAVLEAVAIPMAPDTHRPLAPGPACCFTYTWGTDATGHGFITADAALAGMGGTSTDTGKKGKGKP